MKETTVIDSRLEQKLGFDRIRRIISDRCSTAYAVERTATETFSTNPSKIRKRLLLTDEMRLIMMFEDSFPSGGFIDCIDFLKPLERSSAAIDLLSLRKLRTMLDTLRKVTAFFDEVKDGVYPNLKRMAAPIMGFPEVQRRIEGILDRYGDVKDTASDILYDIRRSLREKEGTISRRMSAILKKAQEEGIVDSDAGVSIRDGKMLIPVSAANKKRIAGFIYDESATGKTAFIEPAEVVELDNQIKELKFAEQREILRILLEFTEFLRPYIPDLLEAARYLGEIDFLMAKAQIALDFIAGMPVVSGNEIKGYESAQGPPSAAGAYAQEGKEGDSPAHRDADPSEAHPAHIGTERRRKISMSQDSRPASVHVPVGNADPDLGDIRNAHLRPHNGRYRRRPVDRQ